MRKDKINYYLDIAQSVSKEVHVYEEDLDVS